MDDANENLCICGVGVCVYLCVMYAHIHINTLWIHVVVRKRPI